MTIRITLRSAFGPLAQRVLPKTYCRCPKCGTLRVERRRRRDHIDSMCYRPGSLFQYLLGGQLYHCVGCRLQFYDVRPQAAYKARGA